MLATAAAVVLALSPLVGDAPIRARLHLIEEPTEPPAAPDSLQPLAGGYIASAVVDGVWLGVLLFAALPGGESAFWGLYATGIVGGAIVALIKPIVIGAVEVSLANDPRWWRAVGLAYLGEALAGALLIAGATSGTMNQFGSLGNLAVIAAGVSHVVLVPTFTAFALPHAQATVPLLRITF